MRLLLDTHALIWTLAGAPELGTRARDVITDPANEVFVSVASLWEIAVKSRIGKLRIDLARMLDVLPKAGLQLLPIEPRHVLQMLELALVPEHKDPFDHLLIAQAIIEGLAFVSEDKRIPRYPVQHIWCSDRPKVSEGV